MSGPRFAIIIPACNEAEALPAVLRSIREKVDAQQFIVAVGANGCTDRTVELARAAGVVIAETEARGYGYGCQVAIQAAVRQHPSVEAFIFFAADGANDPGELEKFVAAFDAGHRVVLGQRTRLRANWRKMTLLHILANRILGFGCGLLTGRFYCDLGPYRLIEREVFESLQMREWTYGWTIEPQILCARLGLSVWEIDVAEHLRIAGEQKVSRVSWRRTLQIGCQIFTAGWRSRFRPITTLVRPCPTLPRPQRSPFRPKDFPNPV